VWVWPHELRPSPRHCALPAFHVQPGTAPQPAIVVAAEHCGAAQRVVLAYHVQPAFVHCAADVPSLFEQPVEAVIDPELSTTTRKYGAIAVACALTRVGASDATQPTARHSPAR